MGVEWTKERQSKFLFRSEISSAARASFVSLIHLIGYFSLPSVCSRSDSSLSDFPLIVQFSSLMEFDMKNLMFHLTMTWCDEWSRHESFHSTVTHAYRKSLVFCFLLEWRSFDWGFFEFCVSRNVSTQLLKETTKYKIRFTFSSTYSLLDSNLVLIANSIWRSSNSLNHIGHWSCVSCSIACKFRKNCSIADCLISISRILHGRWRGKNVCVMKI